LFLQRRLAVFFLLKCVFWLAVLFWFLPWRGGEPAPVAAHGAPGVVARPAEKKGVKPAEAFGGLFDDAASAAGAALAHTARDYCATHAAQCLSAAAAGAGLAAPTTADDKRLKSMGK
jgi:hypothetical protein